MNCVIIEEGKYSFDASAKKVTINDIELDKNQLILITNVDREVVIYSAVQILGQNKGGTIALVGGNTEVTLDFDTTAHADTDELQIKIVNHDINFRDSTNIQTSNLGASGVFTGEFRDLSRVDSYSILYFTTTPLVSVEIEFSEDGITPVADAILGKISLGINFDGTFYAASATQNVPLYRYVRVIITNDTTPQILFGSHFWVNRNAYTGSFGNLNDALSDTAAAMLTRAVMAGRVNDGLLEATSTSANVELMPNGGIKAGIPWDVVFQHATPTDANIPTGTLPTIDLVLNTEPNVLDSGWIPVRAYAGGQFVNIVTDQALKIYLMNASDTSGNNIVGNTTSVGTTVAGVPFTTGAPFFDDYFRVIIVNDSGSATTEITVRSMGLQTTPPSVFQSLSSPIFSFYPAPIVQTIIKAQNNGTGLFESVKSSPSGSLQVAQTDRPDELRDRVAFRYTLENVSVDTLIHTVTAGKTAYITFYDLTVYNDTITTLGRWALTDDGVPIYASLAAGRVVGGVSVVNVNSGETNIGLEATTDIQFQILNATDIRISGVIIGYEEPN